MSGLGHNESASDESKPTQKTSAVIARNTSDQPMTVNIKGDARCNAEVNVEGATGTREVYAAAFEGPGNYTVEERAQISAIVNAGKKVDWNQMDFTRLLKKRLSTIPEQKLANVVKFLAEKFGVHRPSDFELLDLEDMKTKLVELNCLVGVELTRFMELAKEMKEIEQKQTELKSPPSAK